MLQSNYPITATSDMSLGRGAVLGRGLILGGRLYPPCGPVNYGEITMIGRRRISDDTAHIIITADNGEIVTDVHFSLIDSTDTGTLIGQGYYRGQPCGNLVISTKMLPVLKSLYRPRKGSLVLTPSVFRPQPQKGLTGELKGIDGSVIADVLFDSAVFEDLGGGVSVKQNVLELMNPCPVSKIVVQCPDGSSEYLLAGDKCNACNITATSGSSVRLSVKGDELLIGGYRDL